VIGGNGEELFGEARRRGDEEFVAHVVVKFGDKRGITLALRTISEVCLYKWRIVLSYGNHGANIVAGCGHGSPRSLVAMRY